MAVPLLSPVRSCQVAVTLQMIRRGTFFFFFFFFLAMQIAFAVQLTVFANMKDFGASIN